jgi:ribonuclease J
MLQAHLELARECGLDNDNMHLLASGESLLLSGPTAERGEPRTLERHYLDGDHNEVDREAQRERGRVASDGLVIITLPLVNGHPHPSYKLDIRTRGLAVLDGSLSLTDDLRVEIRRSLVTLLEDGSSEPQQMEDQLRRSARRFFRRRTRRMPLIVPVVVEF